MRYIKLFLVVVTTMLVTGCMLAKENVAKTRPQTTCPVMGDRIACLILDRNIYTDYEGKRIYFCSRDCLEKFKKNPEKYIKRLEDQGVLFEEAPILTPMNESGRGAGKDDD